MIRRPRRFFIPLSRAAFAAASVAVYTVLWTNSGAVLAQASGATADAAAAAADTPAQRYAVKPGQSLSDIASELTGSKERAVRDKMARALFDANPNAFAGHDINRLKLGAVLTVPGTDTGGASDAAAAAPASAAPAASAAQQSAPAESAASAAPSAAAPESASAVQPLASEPAGAQSASQAAPVVAPAASAPAAETAPRSGAGLDPKLIGLAVAVLVVLFLLMLRRGSKRRRAAAEAEARQRESAPVSSPMPPVPPMPAAAPAQPANNGAADLDGKAVERDQSELNAVAASLENYEAAQAFAAPSEDDAPASIETAAPEPHTDRAAPFMPTPPAAAHAPFVPPLPHAGMTEADSREAHAREIAAREAASREAEKWEAEEREAAARQTAAREAEEREVRAREEAAREALANELSQRSQESREGGAREAVELEAQAHQAREAAAREIVAREAELREAQALAAEQRAEEQRAAEQRAIEEQAAREAQQGDGMSDDDEPSSPHRFPMPKFPTEAIQALDSLDMGLPPRVELTLNAPPGEDAPASQQPAAHPPIEPVPFLPQPVAETDAAHRADAAALAPHANAQPQSVAREIEAGTAGAASVAGLGATPFGPLSLEFNLDLPSSYTEPLPALTPAQLATIARNKLELAVEYIELGDLSGARTLLQEVIASKDVATHKQAAALLSTLAPHS